MKDLRWVVVACPSDGEPHQVTFLHRSRMLALKELVKLCRRNGHSLDTCRAWFKTEHLVLCRVNLDDCD